MAEGVLFNIAERIIVRLGNRAFQKIGSIWGVQDELNKLKETVEGFQDVLLDAEQKQANNSEVKRWLQSVEDAVYEADDVLDEFNTEVQRRQVMRDNTKLSKVRLFVSSSNQLVFGLEMSHKIKDINKRLSEVASRRPSDLNNCEDTRFISRERVGHSFVPKENIVGRDEDKMAIIQLLLDPISTENVSTISIVGIGGLGKSTLAQVIFNDEVIQKHFELKIWICVSNIFELDILAKKILKVGKLDKKERDMVDQLDMDQLQNDLRKKVNGKKYLLVLDDVWNEDPHKWLSLMDLLKGGGEGSRILITTRTKTVAMTSHTTKQYPLRGLNEVQSWSLFKKMAFQDGKEPENSTIKAVGMEVVRKCKGVPLAIRTIGGMLRTKHQEIEWLNFKERKLSKLSQKEDDILPTLKLSYDLSENPMKRLPDWIVELSNLETLDLRWCQELVELPRDIKKMINLRHLMLDGCVELSGMPRGIGELNGVRTLNRFVLSESNCLGRGASAGLAELASLKELRGHLLIYYLRDVVSESNVGTPLKDKQHLNSLTLRWKEGEDVKGVGEEDIIKSMEVLQPHSNLKHLSVWYYGGVRFASWFSSLINIVNLTLGDCKRCQHLPPLDLLPSLKSLGLWDLERLEYILLSEKESSNSMSDEMMRISFFPSLEKLEISLCPVLKGWWRAHTHNSASSSSSSMENLSLPSFPSLSTLSITNCPNLTSMPLYPNVVEIYLERSSWKVVDSLFVRGAYDITHDVGVDVSASSSSPHLSKLTHLSLRGIEDLASLPEGIRGLPCLNTLTIQNCPMLSERCKKETGEDWPKIAHIPHIDID